MSDWTSGYVADIGYTYGYYSELNPHRGTLAFLNAGFVPPNTGVHCELGFGQGLSVNIHAAASGSSWYGTDFNPTQTAFAKSLQLESGAQAELSDEAFEELKHTDGTGIQGQDQRAISSEYQTILNIGCAEGYYAVGMSRRMPKTKMLAFDLNPKAQQVCSNLAKMNQVEDRVRIPAIVTTQFDRS